MLNHEHLKGDVQMLILVISITYIVAYPLISTELNEIWWKRLLSRATLKEKDFAVYLLGRLNK